MGMVRSFEFGAGDKANLPPPRPKGRGLLEVHPEPCFPIPP
jgi:hypothetical protein